MTRLPPVWLGSRELRISLLSGLVLLLALLAQGQAQITLDGSLGPQGPLTGPNYQIGAELGQVHGSNLFHSFDQFSVPTGGSATFTGPDSIDNIIGRVTGGQPSLIDGVLRSRIAGAHLYLLNPSGVLFGPNARLDVGGSFHVSTADFLRLADGATFSAHLGPESTLTVAAPAAFGFVGSTPAPMTIAGSHLQVNREQTLSLVGGELTIAGQGVLPTERETLSAPSGRIQLVSVASPGDVPVDVADFTGSTLARLGRLELSQGAFVDVSSNGGGAILLRSGQLLVDHAAMFADNLGPLEGSGLGLDLRITGEAVIRNGSLLTTEGFKSGDARDLQLIAGSLQIDGSMIGSSDFGLGAGGNILVQVGTLTLTGGGQIIAVTTASGHGGNITVVATDGISIVGSGPFGESGLFSNTFGAGDAGQITIAAPRLHMDEGLIQAGATPGSLGNAGSIEVRVGQLRLTGGAQIGTSSFGAGRGGEVIVEANESILIAGRTREGEPSGLFSSTQGSGLGGNLQLTSPSFSSAMEGPSRRRASGQVMRARSSSRSAKYSGVSVVTSQRRPTEAPAAISNLRLARSSSSWIVS